MKSYLNKKFVIDDPDARIRKDDDLLAFKMENDKPQIIPRNTEINVTDTRLLNDSVFVNADGWGWTAGSNLKNKFLMKLWLPSSPRTTTRQVLTRHGTMGTSSNSSLSFR